MEINKTSFTHLSISMKFFLSIMILVGFMQTYVAAHAPGEYLIGPRFFSYLLIITVGILIFFLSEAAVKQRIHNKHRQKRVLRALSILIVCILAYVTYHYFLH